MSITVFFETAQSLINSVCKVFSIWPSIPRFCRQLIMMLHEDWNLVVFVFKSRYFLNVMNESIMKPELKNTYRKSSSMNWKWGPLICHKYNRVSPTNHIQEDLIQLWQSPRHLKFDKEGDVFWAQMKPQLSQFAWYFPESWKYRGRCSPEI